MQAAFPMKRESDVRALFDNMRCLRGMLEAALAGMGKAWTDAPMRPRAAVVTAGDFILCGGTAGPSAAHLLRTALRSAPREWLVYAPGAWREVLGKAAAYRLEKRWAFDHHVQPKRQTLEDIVKGLQPGAALIPLAGAWIDRCREEAWSRDFVQEFATSAAYAERGLGTLLTVDHRAAAGASSYLSYPGGIEIQVQTREGCEGRGYATIAAAALILAAHDRSLIATWDAANPASAHMAEKLGYQPMGAYDIAVIEKQDVW